MFTQIKKPASSSSNKKPFSDFMEMDQFPTRKNEDPDEMFIESPRKRQKRQAPYLIFPEILCIIDYDGYRYWNTSTKKRDLAIYF